MNQLQIGQTVKVDGVTIIPIEQISIEREARSHMLWWHGSKQVFALIIVSSGGINAMDTDARKINVEDLISRLPQLAEIINVESEGR